MELILIISISYLMGSIPFGLILTKVLLKKDIREIGSGNIGATNVLRTGNKLIGYLTLILDVLKAVIPVLYIKFNFPELVYISSLSAFIGHVFPIWLKFKGGKGVATYIGFLFGINLILGLFFLITWLAIALVFKYSSLSSLIATTITPIYFIGKSDHYIAIFLIYLLAVIVIKHHENIKRLLNRTENKIKLSK